MVDELCALTYSELAAQVEQLAAYLVQQGVMVGDTVGIISGTPGKHVGCHHRHHVDRAADAPISPLLPSGYMQEIIDDSGLALFLWSMAKPLDALTLCHRDTFWLTRRPR